ncbi:MAG: YwiC-like family protein, partial [Acidimicrobiia bacterium]|nr:YwiC-like family protein [Acidimicrobiia bacterium]
MTRVPSPRLGGVAIPADHGGWGLTLEPVVLGLAVAPGVAGTALGVAALAAFLFRTPFRILVGDLRRGRRPARTRLAVRAATIYGSVLLVAAVIAVLSREHSFWPPLAAAIP